MFDGENISFDASLVVYINSTNIPLIMIIDRIYEYQNLLSQSLVSFLVRLRTCQQPCKCTKVRYAQALINRYVCNDTNILNQFFKDWDRVGRVLKIPQLSYPGVVTLFCETWRYYD